MLSGNGEVRFLCCISRGRGSGDFLVCSVSDGVGDTPLFLLLSDENDLVPVFFISSCIFKIIFNHFPFMLFLACYWCCSNRSMWYTIWISLLLSSVSTFYFWKTQCAISDLICLLISSLITTLFRFHMPCPCIFLHKNPSMYALFSFSWFYHLMLFDKDTSISPRSSFLSSAIFYFLFDLAFFLEKRTPSQGRSCSFHSSSLYHVNLFNWKEKYIYN